MLRFAFKEWAVVCHALAQGRQSLILRKGGIAEEQGEFRPEHRRFWLYPTFVHQQAAGVKPEALPLLDQAQSNRPPEGMIKLTHFVEMHEFYHLHDMVGALRLRHLHIWSDETIFQRFKYRTPGLFAFVVRVFEAPQSHLLPDSPAYQGCKSWVDLEQELPTKGARVVLDDLAFKKLADECGHLLNPTRLA